MPLDILNNRLFNQQLTGIKLNIPNEVVNEFAAELLGNFSSFPLNLS